MGRETQPLNQHFFFFFPLSLSLSRWIEKTRYTMQGNATPEPTTHTLFSSSSLSLSLLDREDTLHDRGGRGSRPGAAFERDGKKFYLFIHHTTTK